MAAQGVKFARIHGRTVPIKQGAGGAKKSSNTKVATALKHYSGAAAAMNKYAYHKKAASNNEFRILGAGALVGVGSLMMNKLRSNPLSKVGHMGAGLVAGGAVMGMMGLASSIIHHAKARGAKVAARRSAKLFKQAGGQINRTSA